MKHVPTLLLAGFASLGLMSTGYAADLIIEEPSMAPVVESSGDWSGPYIGVNVGYGVGTVSGEYDDSWDWFDDPYDISGWIAGVQAGANVQMDSFVLGVEGDVAWSGITGNSDVTGDWVYTDVDWVATLRGRAGIAMDSILIYATAGVAAAGISQWVDDDYSGDTDTVSDTRFGWVAGVGAEAMVADNMSIKGEVLFHGLQAEDVDFDNGTTYYDNGISFTTFKVGLNLHF